MTVPALLSPTTAFLTGLAYGAACCGPSCGPFFCTYVLGTRTGMAQSLKALTVFTISRLLMLGGVGMAAAWFGTALLAPDGRTTLMARCGALIVGAIGIGLLFSSRGEPSKSSLLASLHCRFSHWLGKSALPLWVVGTLFALVPCPPLVAMVACSAQTGSLLKGATLLMLFGLGSITTSLFMLALVSGILSRKINTSAPQVIPWMRRVSGALLLVLSYEILGSGGHL